MKRPPRHVVSVILAEEAARVCTVAAKILCGDRTERVFYARASVCQRLHAMGYSYTAIGKALNSMHHTSVMYACAKDLGAPDPAWSVPESIEPEEIEPTNILRFEKKKKPGPIYLGSELNQVPLSRLMAGR